MRTAASTKATLPSAFSGGASTLLRVVVDLGDRVNL
jgi:hypothetical protein